MSLIPDNVKYYIGEILSKCHETKTNTYYWIFNISVFSIFILVLSSVLYYCYTTKPSKEELQKKMIQDQQYILEKIRFYQTLRNENQSSQITGLPELSSIRL